MRDAALPAPTLRIARPARDPEALASMYAAALNLRVLARFTDHDGFDGVVVGRDGCPWHLEFTRDRAAPDPGPRDPDDLLVLYVPDRREWLESCERAEAAGFTPLAARNPYWDASGKTFQDTEDARLVLQNASWPTSPKQHP